MADGDNAARRARTAVDKAGGAKCGKCARLFCAEFIDIDHVLPLAKGGRDVMSNIQALCKPCHKGKTREDFRHT
ncbi:HNH endonuclease [Streptomyces sp. NPDC050422]|uniref:HNH endonuclease n=1 Tax=Streptomyces sp. NPDC050422 TaxID=3365614 RepID=UPI00378F531D